jgi:hypothetical protein
LNSQPNTGDDTRTAPTYDFVLILVEEMLKAKRKLPKAKTDTEVNRSE